MLNFTYFAIGDSEISYNQLPETYNQSNTVVLEPEFNAQNSSGVPESNRQYIKYPYLVDQGQTVDYIAKYASKAEKRSAGAVKVMQAVTARQRTEAAQSGDVTSDPYTFTPDTGKIDMREQRREIRLIFTSNVQGGDYQLGRVLLTATLGDVRP
jgi:hypothetical protein